MFISCKIIGMNYLMLINGLTSKCRIVYFYVIHPCSPIIESDRKISGPRVLKDEQLCGGAPHWIVAEVSGGEKDRVLLGPRVQSDVSWYVLAPAFDDRSGIGARVPHDVDGLVDEAGVLDDRRLRADLAEVRLRPEMGNVTFCVF